MIAIFLHIVELTSAIPAFVKRARSPNMCRESTALIFTVPGKPYVWKLKETERVSQLVYDRRDAAFAKYPKCAYMEFTMLGP